MYLETGREVNAGSLSIALGLLGTVTATSWRVSLMSLALTSFYELFCYGANHTKLFSS